MNNDDTPVCHERVHQGCPNYIVELDAAALEHCGVGIANFRRASCCAKPGKCFRPGIFVFAVQNSNHCVSLLAGTDSYLTILMYGKLESWHTG